MNSLIIMAGGVSSRMKRSLGKSKLSESKKKLAQSVHKSLIPLGIGQKPLIFHLISNAVASGYSDIYLITSPENQAFQEYIGKDKSHNTYAGAKVSAPGIISLSGIIIAAIKLSFIFKFL